jgi:pyridoxal phosphate enzyme (YggS family)
MPELDDNIGENLNCIRSRIHQAAVTAGREPADICLIAVSKYMPVEYLRRAMQSGQYIFGENTIQDASRKLSVLSDPRLEWHFIGHLQSNKARLVPGNFHWLHTLDTLKLARKLAAACSNDEHTLQVLLQVNIASDPGKYGLPPESTEQFAAELLRLELPGLQLRGLMTIGREHATPEERRHDFIALRKLRDHCATRLGAAYFSELSMGMSNDFEIAIAEGATMIRVGSSIFGPRP